MKFDQIQTLKNQKFNSHSNSVNYSFDVFQIREASNKRGKTERGKERGVVVSSAVTHYTAGDTACNREFLSKR